MTLIDPFAFALVSAGIFAGAVVSGLLGFAFSAVAGAILLHVLPPTEAVPLMMACSILTQIASLVVLRRAVQWRSSPLLIAGGVLGTLPALYLLFHVDARMFRVGFGIFLIAYTAVMLRRPAAAYVRDVPSRVRHAFVGFGGGLVGGLTAMPGVLPTLWCERRGLPKEQQRGFVQPYIMAMQVFALALMLSHNTLPSQMLVTLTYNLPALGAGVALGIVLFRRVNDALFRNVLLAVLLFAGCLLVV